MRIAQLAPLVESVPPRRYGGTERVVHWLCEELLRRGHDVTLFASGDSRTSGRLVPGAPRALRAAGAISCETRTLSMLGQAFARAREFDVIHSHVDWLAFPFGRLVETPVVHTLHGRLDLAHLPPLLAAQPELALVSISDAQRAPVPRTPFVATVHHGMPASLFAPALEPREDYLLFLGRTSPEKGPLLAIEAARAAGLPLVMAAKVDAADRAYFEEVLRPRLRRSTTEFLGEVDDAEKARLLGRARALLAPIDWPEPFGLVFIEALATGTPIVTRPCGSAPELVEHGRTGLLARSRSALVAALRGVQAVDPRECRASFEARFTVERMASRYEAVYAHAIERRGLPPHLEVPA